jgi:hypothetical protein
MTATKGITVKQNTGKKLKDLEQILEKRRRADLPSPRGWEREMVRGYIHTFDEYQLPITNHLGEQEIIIIHEDAAMIATRVWDCAVLTAKWIENMSHDRTTASIDLVQALGLKVPSKSDRPIQVLELGAGTGLLSVCLAKMGAAVLSTEYGPVVKHLEEGCRSNHVLAMVSDPTTLTPGKVRCRDLDWFKETETLESMFKEGERAVFDLIIVTDCSLTERDSDGVFSMIEKYATKGQTRVVVGSCIQREGTPRAVQNAKAYPNYRQVDSSQQHADYSSSRFHIMTFDA